MSKHKSSNFDPANWVVNRIAKRCRVSPSMAKLLAERAGFRPVGDNWQPLAHVVADIVHAAGSTREAHRGR
jgi:hypothetical protein